MTKDHTMIGRKEFRSLIAQMQRNLPFAELEEIATKRLGKYGIIIIDLPGEPDE